MLGDSAQTIEWRDRFDEFSQQNLYQLPLFSIRLGLPLGDAHRSVEFLAAVRRRANDLNPSFLWTLPSFLRLEGRLAAEVGDTAGAIRAYEHYLTLRTDPDPPLAAQRDSVVAELSELVAGGR